MTRFRLPLLTLLLVALGLPALAHEKEPAIAAPEPPRPESPAATIQIAILLDHSGSMGGLINQARTHLWSVVNQFAATRYEGKIPNLHVALYKYGDHGPEPLLPLTNDLDAVSEALFSIQINGGHEKCGEVIMHAVENLEWSTSNKDYKAIFIAGNEPFTQGDVDYKEACKAAITKGIIVNTIHCGDEATGRQGMWHDGAALADGTFLNIDQNKVLVHIESPHDAEISKLNAELNGTYLAYGNRGRERAARQEAQDALNTRLSKKASLDRAASKAGANYRNDDWDLVDAVAEDKVKLAEVEADDLPEPMKEMSAEEREKYVAEMAEKRAEIQAKIKDLTGKRNEYVVAERNKRAEETGEADLGDAMLGAVRLQLKEKNYEVAE